MGIANIWKKNRRFIKFAAVGCSNTAINLAVYYLLVYFGVHYLAAYTCGFLVSVCNAFYWNNRYVFKDKQEKNIVHAFLKVTASYGISFLFSVFFMWMFVEILHGSSAAAPILKMFLTVPLNYMLNKVWAFKVKNPKSVPDRIGNRKD